jgi:hypothetical protein
MPKLNVEVSRLYRAQHKFKATAGVACGIGNSVKEATENCYRDADDILNTDTTPRMEVRQGFLIISQRVSSTQAWYCIKELAALTDGSFHMSCGLAVKDLAKSIDSDLAARMADR